MIAHSTTTGYRYKAAAAFAASCVVGAAPVHADATSSGRFGLDHLRYAYGSSLDWIDGADSHVVVYVEAFNQDDALRASLAARETTEQEHLIATLRSYERLGENWDGEGAAPPVIRSLQAASDFVCLLTPDVEMPAPMIHASGHAGLTWSGGNADGELEFLEDGAIAYYFADGRDKHSGVVTLEAKTIPQVLEVLIPSA